LHPIHSVVRPKGAKDRVGKVVDHNGDRHVIDMHHINPEKGGLERVELSADELDIVPFDAALWKAHNWSPL